MVLYSPLFTKYLLALVGLLAIAPLQAESSPPNSELQTLILGTRQAYFTENINSRPSVRIVNEALAQLGYKVELKPAPGKRILQKILRNEWDGDIHRAIGDIAEYDENLIRVKEPNFTGCAALYTLMTTGKRKPEKTLSIGVSRHADTFIDYLYQTLPNIKVVKVNDYRQAGRMMIAGRIDSMIMIDRLVDEYQSLLNIKLHKLINIGHAEVYMYLSPKHADLAKALAPVLRDLKKHPRYQQLTGCVDTTN